MEENKNILILGAGNWGTTFARLLADKDIESTLWFRDSTHFKETENTRINSKYLPGIELSPAIHLTDSLDCLTDSKLVVLAIPANTIREVLTRNQAILPKSAIYLSLAKGLELKSGKRISEVMQEVLPDESKIACLSGPNIAHEIAERKPATSVIVAHCPKVSSYLQNLVSCAYFRAYTNTDMAGVEISGALKNVIAIAAGICQELKLGDNSLAALITRGIAEIARYGMAFGANPLTFMGMAGVGDLSVTCMSGLSRNNRLGHLLARGVTLENAIKQTKMVVEGVSTCEIVTQTARKLGIYMPICFAVHSILFEGIAVPSAIASLMQNHLREEMDRSL
jgi:glycerol-3-phosphate dehydrogenase (NAD(P)+)